MNAINMTYEYIHTEYKLNKHGIKKTNSTSYKTKNTHRIVKFKLNCMSTSVVALKPHS